MTEVFISELIKETSNVIHNHSKSLETTNLEEKKKIWKEKHKFIERVIKQFNLSIDATYKTPMIKFKASEKKKELV